jgi:hypothetical protein
MADSKITALTSIGTSTDPVLDQMVIVDVSDGSMAATGTTKKVSLNQLLSSNPSATGGLTLSGALAAGSATITGDLTVDTSTLKVDSANNRVGVLTATPRVSLDVASGDIYSAGQVTWGGSSPTANQGFLSYTGGNAVIGSTGATSLLFYTNGAERYSIGSTGISTWSVGGSTAMTLNSTGLGVGVTPSAGRLHIKGGAAQSPLVLDTLGYNQIVLQLNGANRGQIYADATNCFALVDSTGSNLRLVVTDTGNVGVGVTPSAWGAAYKAVQQQFGASFFTSNAGSIGLSGNCYNDGTNWVYSSNNPATRYEIGPDAGNHRWFSAAAGTGTIAFGSAKMTLDASGNLLVGTTSGSRRLEVSGKIGVTDAIEITGNNSVSAATGNGQAAHGSSTTLGNVLLGQGSSYDITFLNKSGSVAGYVATGATTITTSSDERIKENLVPITNAISKVSLLRGVIGNFVKDFDPTLARQPFLIAQDVDKVLPEAVVKANPDQWGVNYTQVIPLLVAAIQELTAEVNALKNA